MSSASNSTGILSRSEKEKAVRVASTPAGIECQQCHVTLTEIYSADALRLTGLEYAHGAYCAACKQSSWKVDGSPEAIRANAKVLHKLTQRHLMP